MCFHAAIVIYRIVSEVFGLDLAMQLSLNLTYLNGNFLDQ